MWSNYSPLSGRLRDRELENPGIAIDKELLRFSGNGLSGYL